MIYNTAPSLYQYDGSGLRKVLKGTPQLTSNASLVTEGKWYWIFAKEPLVCINVAKPSIPWPPFSNLLTRTCLQNPSNWTPTVWCNKYHNYIRGLYGSPTKELVKKQPTQQITRALQRNGLIRELSVVSHYSISYTWLTITRSPSRIPFSLRALFTPLALKTRWNLRTDSKYLQCAVSDQFFAHHGDLNINSALCLKKEHTIKLMWKQNKDSSGTNKRKSRIQVAKQNQTARIPAV